jgi:hypothetical protein
LGDQRGGGSEWEPIKILLERYGFSSEMNTAEIPKSLLPQTPRVCQDHIATGVLRILGTNHTSNQSNHTQITMEKVLGSLPDRDRPDCRMDLHGPTTSVGTRTDYSVGPWDYPACATRHLMALSTRTAEEKYSVRKLYMSCTVWKIPRRTRLVLSPYSDM